MHEAARIDTTIDLRRLAFLIAVAVGVLFLWNTAILYPLRILVVFFHEMSHGLAAILTGGEVHAIEVVAREGGTATSSGGNRFITASAGYLGSMMWGGVILLAAIRTRWARVVSIALGAVLVLVTLWLVRNGFGLVFGLAAGAALIAAGRRLDRDVNELILSAIGLTSVLYAIWDIESDIIDRPHLTSDAHTIGQLTGTPTLLWGLIWGGLALAMAAAFLHAACRRKSSAA